MPLSPAAAVGLVVIGLAKASVILCAGLAVSRTRWGRRVGQRHLWLACFIGIAALPVLEWLLPVLRVGSLNLPHGLVAAELGYAPFKVSLETAVLGLWAAGTGVILAGLILDHRKARLLATRAAPATDPRLLGILVRAEMAVGSRTPVSLKLTTRLASPALLGRRNPTLLLPPESVEWEDDEVFAVLCHELHHLRRGDLAINAGERLIAAALWPNPLIHAARRRAAFHRELAADRAALDAGASPERFAARMIAIAKQMRHDRPPRTALAFGSEIRFEARLRALFAHPEPREGSPALMACLAMVFALVVALLAASTPVACIPGTAAAQSRPVRC